MAAIAIKVMHHKEQVREQPEMAAAPATAAAAFRPLDPDIVNETIPAFFIGRNRQGFWLARDVNGRNRRHLPVRELGGGVCEDEQRRCGVRHRISVGAVRARPGKPWQSLCRAARIVHPGGDASSTANGRPHRQDDGAGQALEEGFLK